MAQSGTETIQGLFGDRRGGPAGPAPPLVVPGPIIQPRKQFHQLLQLGIQ
jgi:hypothetical protein